jgi:hypothetical protein
MPRRAALVVGFCLFIVLYVACVGNFIEFGENNRFRAATNPQILILATLVTKYAVFNLSRSASRRSRARSREPVEAD